MPPTAEDVRRRVRLAAMEGTLAALDRADGGATDGGRDPELAAHRRRLEVMRNGRE